MATLVPTPKKLVDAMEYKPGDNFATYYKRAAAAFAELEAVSDVLPEGEVVGALISFPYADGRAFYQVVSAKPLKLCHIPYADAWHVDTPTIRGLRLADVQSMVQQARAWGSVVSKRKVAA